MRSTAMAADAFQTTACWWLSLAALAGVGLNGLFGWWWADPAAALVIAFLVVREGREAWNGKGLLLDTAGDSSPAGQRTRLRSAALFGSRAPLAQPSGPALQRRSTRRRIARGAMRRGAPCGARSPHVQSRRCGRV